MKVYGRIGIKAANMVSITEVVLWLAPTAILLSVLIAVLANLATRRTDTAEYRRLADRVRHLEADHAADLAQITNAREEIFYLGRLISLLAEQMEISGVPIPAPVQDYLRTRRARIVPLVPDPENVVLVQHALMQYFSDGELRQLAFDLGVEYENIPGETKTDKARELTRFMDRRGQMELLIQTIQEARPNAPLPLGDRGPPY